MKREILKMSLMAWGLLMFSMAAKAQLSTNPDKFLGNITTGWPGSMDYNGFKYSDYWNQVTPENGTKWGTVEGTRNSYNWSGADPAFKYANEHGFPFKFHCLVWGSQYPNWIKNLSAEDRYKAIEKWMDKVKSKYPDLKLIDVVNEAIDGHQADTYLMREALGGNGTTGYDWIIKAFEMAHERWPDAILIYNDFNTFQWNTDQFIDLVKTLRDAGAPIDAYGCQSHDLKDMSQANLKKVMTKIQDALKMPMYISEYDIGDTNDENQKKNYQQHIPVMWEADYCAGITLWGWMYGNTWIDGNGEKGISGIVKNKKERPALEWLREYMQTDAAKQAKSPFPGMVKEASVYVKAGEMSVERGTEVPITLNVRLKTKTIESVKVYVNEEEIFPFTEETRNATGGQQMYYATYTPAEKGDYTIKAVVTATDGTQYERLSGFKVFGERSPYNGVKQIPGIIEAEDFDGGGEGYSFHDSDNINEGDYKPVYRTDSEGVDLVKGNNGCVIGYTATGEWLEYTINVTQAGEYEYEATVSAGNDNAGFSISVINNNGMTQLAKVSVPKTGNSDWNNYKVVKGKLSKPLEAGEQILRITIDSPYANIDKIELKLDSETGIQGVKTDDHQETVYNLAGQKVNSQYKGIVIRNGKKVIK